MAATYMTKTNHSVASMLHWGGATATQMRDVLWLPGPDPCVTLLPLPVCGRVSHFNICIQRGFLGVSLVNQVRPTGTPCFLLTYCLWVWYIFGLSIHFDLWPRDKFLQPTASHKMISLVCWCFSVNNVDNWDVVHHVHSLLHHQVARCKLH